MSVVRRQTYVCFTLSLIMISTPVLAQATRISTSSDSQKSSLSVSPTSSGISSRATDGQQSGTSSFGNSDNSNSDNSNSDNSNSNGINSRDKSQNSNFDSNSIDPFSIDHGDVTAAQNSNTFYLQSLIVNIGNRVVEFMQTWENGPNELVPSFMASDVEINAALTKVLNRPAEHGKPR